MFPATIPGIGVTSVWTVLRELTVTRVAACGETVTARYKGTARATSCLQESLYNSLHRSLVRGSCGSFLGSSFCCILSQVTLTQILIRETDLVRGADQHGEKHQHPHHSHITDGGKSWDVKQWFSYVRLSKTGLTEFLVLSNHHGWKTGLMRALADGIFEQFSVFYVNLWFTTRMKYLEEYRGKIDRMNITWRISEFTLGNLIIPIIPSFVKSKLKQFTLHLSVQ